MRPDRPVCITSPSFCSAVRNLWGLLFMTIFSIAIYGQDGIKFAHLSEREGISQPSVTCMIQDHYGFMWIGTRDGLNRYDGSQFKIYRYDPDDPNSISNNTISCLYEDRDGYLWIGTDGGGLNRYDPLTETFHQYIHDPESPGGLSHNTITSLCQDPAGTLWIGTLGGGLNGYDAQKDTFTVFSHSPEDTAGPGSSEILSVFCDAEGMIWVGADGGGLSRFDPGSGRFRHFRNDPDDPDSLRSDYVHAIYEDRDGVLWLTAWGRGLFRFDRRENRFRQFTNDPSDPNSLVNDVVFAITEDADGHLWLGTREGLVRFDRTTGRFQTFTASPSDPYGLKHNVVYSLYSDRSGGLWVGTWGDGINRMSRDAEHSRYFLHRPSDPNSLSKNDVFAVYQDREDIIWIGTEGGGLNRYDPATGRFRHFRHDPGDPFSISSDDVYSILEGENNDLWIATWGGLNRFDRNSGRFYQYLPDRTDADRQKVKSLLCLYQDSGGKLWIGTSGFGLKRFDPATGEFLHYPPNPDAPDSLSHGEVMTILETSDGMIWVGTRSGGLNRLDPATGIFTRYLHNPKDPEGLGSNGIYALFEDPSGRLWIGTRGDGLNILDNHAGLSDTSRVVFRKFREKDGLPDNWVIGLADDGAGDLLVSTSENIIKLDTRTGSVTKYDVSGANQGAFFRNPRNGMIYSGNVGVQYFHPDSLGKNAFQPPVVISQFRRYNSTEAEGVPIYESGVYARDAVNLTYRDKILVFEFASLDYDHPGEKAFAYKMTGFSDQWIQLGPDRQATFTKLSPGDYRLDVKSFRENSLGSESEVSLNIVVRPPWWNTWWAKLLFSAAGIFILWVFFRNRMKAQKAKLAQRDRELAQERQVTERLKQVDKLKDQFLANTSHELRTPLQGIIGISEYLHEDADKVPLEELRENLSITISSGKRLNKLVDDILDFSKLKNRDIDLRQKPVSLYALTDIVLKNITPLVRGKNLELINAVPPDGPDLYADEDRLQQILYNLVGNAVKFTESGFVKIGTLADTRVSATGGNGLLTIFVQDSGIGIPEDQQADIFEEFQQAGYGALDHEIGAYSGTGLGLSISKKLVELHGGKMWVESAPGKGTTFFFELPALEKSEGNTATSEKNDVSGIMPPDRHKEIFEGREAGRTPPPAVVQDQDRSDTEASRSKPARILIVDDEPVNQQVLKNHLSREHYQVRQAMNGEEALKILAKEDKFDLVLLDIMMPKMSGYEVCENIRRLYLPSQLPVIMITAKNQVEDLVQGLQLGANDYLAKPFSRQEFLARVKTQLELHRINEVTGKFVPVEFLRALGRERITELTLEDYTERQVTVFFSDIRGFTSLSEKMTPEDNFQFIKAYNQLMGPVIQKHGGFVNQYLGDAIMAIFPDDPADALHAAVEMQQVLSRFNQGRAENEYPAIYAGMGLHTGPLIMGIIGDENRMDAATISDTVNTASRIEALTKHFGVNILLTEDSLQKISGKENSRSMDDKAAAGPAELRNLRYLGHVLVKGKALPVGVYECFDGDPARQVELKKMTRNLFELGLNHYLEKDFSKACEIFDQVLRQNPEDGPARLFFDRARDYLAVGVPDSWSGIEQMLNK